MRMPRTLLALPLLLLAAFCLPVKAAQPAPLELRMAVNSLPASLGNPFRGNGRPGSQVWWQALRRWRPVNGCR